MEMEEGILDEENGRSKESEVEISEREQGIGNYTI